MARTFFQILSLLFIPEKLSTKCRRATVRILGVGAKIVALALIIAH